MNSDISLTPGIDIVTKPEILRGMRLVLIREILASIKGPGDGTSKSNGVCETKKTIVTCSHAPTREA